MDAKTKKAGRRGFLLGAGAAGVAGAAAVATRPTTLAPAEPAAPRKHPKGGGGYHESEHVQRYYRTTGL